MALKGAVIGGLLGLVFGGLWGMIFGAVIGSHIERRMMRLDVRQTTSGRSSGNTTAVFYGSAAAMLAKMAKADGRITRDEIAVVEAAFRRLGFSESARRYAVGVFRKAKDDDRSIYAYANDFTATVRAPEIRVLFYELLWDLACADGRLTSEEDAILRRIPSFLHIQGAYYLLFRNEHLDGRSSSGSSNRGATRPAPAADELADAYRQLGVAPSVSDAAVKKAYHQMAKRYHPDTLRAQGLPEEMMKKATERMAKINAAWALIREKRGI